MSNKIYDIIATKIANNKDNKGKNDSFDAIYFASTEIIKLHIILIIKYFIFFVDNPKKLYFVFKNMHSNKNSIILHIVVEIIIA